MSFYQTRRFLPQRFRLVLLSLLQTDGLPFSDVLSEGEIQNAFDEHNVAFAQEDGDVYTPAITLWAFLSQVLHSGNQRSCLAAVSRVIVLLVALGREPCAKNRGAYCRARAKLPEIVIEHLTLQIAQGCEQATPDDWLWYGRHLKLADRSFCSYFMIAMLLERNVDFVARLPHARQTDWCRSERLGKGDHLVVWTRPARPDWMDPSRAAGLDGRRDLRPDA